MSKNSWMHEDQLKEYYELEKRGRNLVNMPFITFEEYIENIQNNLKLIIIKTEKPMNIQQEKLTKTPRQSVVAEGLEYILKQQDDIIEIIRMAVIPIERIDGHFDYSPSEGKDELVTASEWNVKGLMLKISQKNEQIHHMLQDVNMNLNRNL